MPRLLRRSLALVFLHALPACAGAMAPDAGTIDCRQLLAMDKLGQITVAMATKDALPADAFLQSLSDEEVLRLALTACAEHPDAKVPGAVKAKD